MIRWRRRPRSKWRPRPIPPYAQLVLEQIPASFRDDGCTWALDALLGVDWRFACRIHDWRGCSRCQPSSALTLDGWRRANQEIVLNARAVVPTGWRAVPAMVGATLMRVKPQRWFDTCGPYMPLGASEEQIQRGWCRHDQPLPNGWGLTDP